MRDQKSIDLLKAVVRRSLGGQDWTLTGLRQDQLLDCCPDAVWLLAEWAEEFGIAVDEDSRTFIWLEILSQIKVPSRNVYLRLKAW